jgi:hypothetical protein
MRVLLSTYDSRGATVAATPLLDAVSRTLATRS